MNLSWKHNGPRSVVFYIEQGDEAIDAAVHEGGDGLWTAWACRMKLGRLKKIGRGRIKPTTVRFEYLMPRPKEQAQAKQWAESHIKAMLAELPAIDKAALAAKDL